MGGPEKTGYPEKMGRSALQELEAKTDEMLPGEGRWKVYYLGFARSGWTVEAQRYADDLESRASRGEDWQALGMKLLDLKQVDQDLADWTT
jgi:hypothetical protein